MSRTTVAASLRAALDPFEGICTCVRSVYGPLVKAALNAISSPAEFGNARMQSVRCIAVKAL
jgi:hypothetical protein